MNWDSVLDLAARIYGFFASISAGDWMLFAAEVFVGAVIYMEVEHGRNSSFLAKATSEQSDHDRREIYRAFLSSPGDKHEKSKGMLNKLIEHSEEAEQLRVAVMNTLSMFNELGFEVTRWFSQWRSGRSRRGLVAFFPHSPVCFWYMTGLWIQERRKLTGPWFAQNALIFIKRSVEYVLRYRKDISMSLPGEDQPIIITHEELRKMKADLSAMIAELKAI
jgi:hypothetical protein